MATGAKEVVVPRCLREEGEALAQAEQPVLIGRFSRAEGAGPGVPTSGSRGHVGEGKLKLRFCTVPHLRLRTL